MNITQYQSRRHYFFPAITINEREIDKTVENGREWYGTYTLSNFLMHIALRFTRA